MHNHFIKQLLNKFIQFIIKHNLMQNRLIKQLINISIQFIF